MNTLSELILKFKEGNIRALSKLITLVENWKNTEEILSSIYERVGRAHRVGFTGPPGAGKSSLLNKLSIYFKEKGRNVSILAVDPSSPFSGGALLGDRFRMVEATNKGIYIRSMASRGSLGGIARATVFVADLMDAFGFDPIFIETVGVGQIELDIMKASDTVVVILVPESGDSIQAMKAGLMEIGDIFVVNKSDREGADRFIMELKSILDFGGSLKDKDWKPPVIKASALRGEGIEEIYEAIEKHRNYLQSRGKLSKSRRNRYKSEIEDIIKQKLWESFKSEINFDELVEDAFNERKSPYKLANEILRRLKNVDTAN